MPAAPTAVPLTSSRATHKTTLLVSPAFGDLMVSSSAVLLPLPMLPVLPLFHGLCCRRWGASWSRCFRCAWIRKRSIPHVSSRMAQQSKLGKQSRKNHGIRQLSRCLFRRAIPADWWMIFVHHENTENFWGKITIKHTETRTWLSCKPRPCSCFLINMQVNLVSIYRGVNMYEFAFLSQDTLVKLVLELLKVWLKISRMIEISNNERNKLIRR